MTIVLMVKTNRHFKSPSFSKRVLVVVGGYGSGKSEVSVNLARHLVAVGQLNVAIADLDIVNPYFRSREVDAQMETLGIETIHPKGSHAYADLPIIIPQVKSAIEGYDGALILDVGGDDAGARVLSSLAGSFPPDDHEVFFVLNANRPFNSDVDSCLQLMERIKKSARLKFTAIISNTHMVEHTTSEDILKGIDLATKLSRVSALPVVFIAAMRKQLSEINPEQIDVPVLPLDRLLLKPWEKANDFKVPPTQRKEK